jgi:hypothetical protein
VHAQLPPPACFLQLPSLCWIFGAGGALPWLCGGGVLAAALLFMGVCPAACLFFLWADYLSIIGAGQVFYDFQWDALLLETTFLAIFLAPWTLLPGWRLTEPPRLARWLLWWLLARLMFLSGIVKLASGDATWHALTALTVHFQTQPLPTPLAWYAHQLPAWALRACCFLMFAIELGAPIALWLGRRWRHPAAVALIFLQVIIALTGNYTFFNLLTVSLCVLCLGVERVVPNGLAKPAVGAAPTAPGGNGAQQRGDGEPEGRVPKGWPRQRPQRAPALLRPVAFAVVFITAASALAELIPAVAAFPGIVPLIQIVAPFRTFNNYGLFAQMTTTRPELIIEGSDDGHDWKPYVLPAKPGPLNRRPTFVAPGQPRLDWQLWFAALESPDSNPWVGSLVRRLLQGAPEVLALFRTNPFPAHPPRQIRIVRYEYAFTTPAERRATGNWWRRTFIDFYTEPTSL